MSLQRIHLLVMVNICLALSFQVSYGQSSEFHPLTLNNWFIRSAIGQNENIYNNPIMLCGEPLNYNTFNITAKGELALVNGNPEVSEPSKIPFTVQLHRNGSVLKRPELDFLNQELYEIEISEVLAYARHGDHLIINPTRLIDWKAKRIIRLSEPGC
jgi:hypothetical protein